jgi:hypothetical protein
MEQRRLRAGHVFDHGATQTEVTRTRGVSCQSVNVWYHSGLSPMTELSAYSAKLF